MKTIVNICLTGPFSDGFSYQDNLLPKYHARLGLRTIVIAPTWAWSRDGELIHVEPGRYVNEDQVEVVRIENDQHKPVSYRFKTYRDLERLLVEYNPDIVFLHGCQLRDAKTVATFMCEHPNKQLFVDNHADDYNSASNFISKHFLHNIYWRHYARLLAPYATRFWGVAGAACSFLDEHYGVPKHKIGYLPLGADDELIDSPDRGSIRITVRKAYGISDGDFLVVMGGKLDRAKNVTPLIEAVGGLPDNVRLLLFGSADAETKSAIDNSVSRKVIYAGWQNSLGVRDLLFAADFVVFPGSQSSLWMQAVATGVPGAFRFWQGGNEVDCGGNSIILRTGSSAEIKSVLCSVASDRNRLNHMTEVARSEGPNRFSYSALAAKSIGWAD